MIAFRRLLGLALMATALAPAGGMAAPREIVLGWPATITMTLAPLAAAHELGYLEKEGLKVKVVELKGTSVVLPQVATKAIEIGYVGPEPLSALKQPGRAPIPVRFFFNSTPRYTWDIIVPAKGDIRTIADLKGKKLGVQVMTNTHMPITRVLMKNHGLTENKDYQFQTIGYSGQALYSLMRGDADAYYIGWNEIALYQAMGADLRVLPMDAKFKALFGNGYIAHDDTIKNDPDLLGGFARALTKATLVCQGAPEWCVQTAWKAHPQIKLKDGTEAEILSKSVSILQAILKNQLPDGAKTNPSYGSFTDDAWTSLFALLHEGGELPNSNIAPGSIYTNDLVGRINAFDHNDIAKTIVRLKSGQ